MSRRIERVNVLIRKEISSVIANQLNDPRLSHLISVVRVETSADLAYARVYVSIMADPDVKKTAINALESASGFIYRTVKKRVILRAMPYLTFYLDESIERGTEMLDMIDQAMAQLETTE